MMFNLERLEEILCCDDDFVRVSVSGAGLEVDADGLLFNGRSHRREPFGVTRGVLISFAFSAPG